MKANEGTWLDFEGNAFGSGKGNSFQLAAGQTFQNWNQAKSDPEPNDSGNEDYTTIARSNGKWNDHYASNPVVCNKPNQKGTKLNQALKLSRFLN